MDLKRRLPVTLLLVSVIPMMIIGLVTFDIAEREAVKFATEKLDALAAIQEARVEEVVDSNIERLELVSSRTQLRISLERFLREAGDEDLVTMRRILADARGSIPDFEEISVLDQGGRVLASTDPSSEGTSPLTGPQLEKGVTRSYLEARSNDQIHHQLLLVGPLVLDNRTIGVICIKASMDSIIDVTRDRTGLGQTGESMVAMRGADGNAHFITPLRFEIEGEDHTMPKERTDAPIIQALSRTENTFTQDVDYRGQAVLAATRYIPATDWGLVVKIDSEEITNPIDRAQDRATAALFILMMPVIAIALMTAHSISRPLMKLRSTLEDISLGNMEATIDPELTGSRDEIGELARAFERMMVSLKLAMKLTAPELKRESDELRKTLREKEEVQRALEESEVRYRFLFEHAPISMWEEDFSEGKKRIEELKREGVTDLDSYLDNHPEELVKLARIVRVIDVNQHTLDLYKASSKDELLAGLPKVFKEESYAMFRHEIVALAEGKTRFEADTVNYALDGERLAIRLSLSIPERYTDTWERVYLTIQARSPSPLQKAKSDKDDSVSSKKKRGA